MPIPRAAAVVVADGEVLVIKRYLKLSGVEDCVMCENSDRPEPECPGHRYAVLPGGHVEADEDAETAAIRELEEETTLTANIERLLWTGLHNRRPAYYFLMTEVEGTAELSGPEAEAHCDTDSFELVWAGPDELGALGLYPAELVGQVGGLLLVD
jgi:ADP-ribose pyrophosphatase YjhB (NUDIX family)